MAQGARKTTIDQLQIDANNLAPAWIQVVKESVRRTAAAVTASHGPYEPEGFLAAVEALPDLKPLRKLAPELRNPVLDILFNEPRRDPELARLANIPDKPFIPQR